MRAARLSKTHVYEMYAIWELRACPKIYACETHACERHVCEMHAYEMAYGRSTHMRWPMGEARI
jgi:hypothetical protein